MSDEGVVAIPCGDESGNPCAGTPAILWTDEELLRDALTPEPDEAKRHPRRPVAGNEWFPVTAAEPG